MPGLITRCLGSGSLFGWVVRAPTRISMLPQRGKHTLNTNHGTTTKDFLAQLDLEASEEDVEECPGMGSAPASRAPGAPSITQSTTITRSTRAVEQWLQWLMLKK